MGIFKPFRKNITLKVVGFLLVFSTIIVSLMGFFLYQNRVKQVQGDIKSRLNVFNSRVDSRIQTITGEMEQSGVLFNQILRQRMDSSEISFSQEKFPRSPDGTIRISNDSSGLFVPAGTPLDEETKKFISVSEAFFKEVEPFVKLSFTDIFYTTNSNIFRLNPPGNWIDEVEADYDANNYPFYHLATEEMNPSRKPVWTPIYFDANLDSWLTSLLVPDYVDGILMGVSGNDFALNRIFEEFIEMANQDSETQSAIFSSTGELVFFPGSDEKMNHGNLKTGSAPSDSARIAPELQAVVQQYLDSHHNNGEMIHFFVDNTKFAAVVWSLDFLDWQLVSYISHDHFKGNLNKDITQVVLILLIFIVFISIIIAQGIRHFILNRIIQLKKFTDGYLENRAFDFKVSGEDEIAELSLSFTTLARNINRRIEMENIVTQVSQMFLNSSREKVDSQIEESLAMVGNFSNADRAYLFIYSKDHSRLHNTHEWVRSEIPPEKDFYADITSESLAELNTAILAKQIFSITDSDEIDDNSPLKNLLKNVSGKEGAVRSLICCPIVRKGVAFGFIGFDSVKNIIAWDSSDTQILTMIGQIFYEAILRIETEEIRHQSQKMDAIGQLAGGVAHDFNNMLGGIIGATEMLEMGVAGQDEESREYIGMILKASDQAATLTQKLLAFGRKGNTASDAIDVHLIIDDCLTLLNRTVDKKIELRTEKKALRSIVTGMNSEVQNIIINLCINSSHAMPNGGYISIETENIFLDSDFCKNCHFQIEPNEYIKVSVRDSGTGIPKENIPKIFEPFFTTKKQGSGTGLGLASVYGSMLDHNGAITVYSEVGSGTVFHLFFPLSVQKIESQPTRKDMIPGKGTILLVDDEAFILATGKRMLEINGYTVLLASDGKEGARVYRQEHHRIDLVISDMIMPKINGSELFKTIRKINPEAKVIISSGFTKDESLNDLKKLGLAGYISKPFRMAELSEVIKSVL